MSPVKDPVACEQGSRYQDSLLYIYAHVHGIYVELLPKTDGHLYPGWYIYIYIYIDDR